MLEGCEKGSVAINTRPMLGPKIKAKYGKILPELADPEERGPSSISEAKEDKADML